MNGYNPDRPVAQTFEDAVAMTCEQRRARAYGIEETAERVANAETPPPQPLDYDDPTAYFSAMAEWLARFDHPHDHGAFHGSGEGENR